MCGLEFISSGLFLKKRLKALGQKDAEPAGGKRLAERQEGGRLHLDDDCA